MVGRHRPVPLHTGAVREALTPLAGAAAATLVAGPGPGGVIELDLVGRVVYVSLSVHGAEASICAVSATLYGWSDDEEADRDEVEPVVTALLALAESTGGVLDSNVGIITRQSLPEVLRPRRPPVLTEADPTSTARTVPTNTPTR